MKQSNFNLIGTRLCWHFFLFYIFKCEFDSAKMRRTTKIWFSVSSVKICSEGVKLVDFFKFQNFCYSLPWFFWKIHSTFLSWRIIHWILIRFWYIGMYIFWGMDHPLALDTLHVQKSGSFMALWSCDGSNIKFNYALTISIWTLLFCGTI